MALNWTMLSDDRSPVPLPHELIIRTVEPPSVELTLLIPSSIGSAPQYSTGPSSSSSPSAPSNEKKITTTGGLWLTDTRLIFVAAAPPADGVLDSLSVPLTAILATKFEQPFFGANFLALDVRPTPGGGLADGTHAELRFRDKGLFEFVGALEKTRERAIYMRRQGADEEEGLPSYNSPGPSLSTTPMPPNANANGEIPLDAPPAYDA
ncbi:GRAM domain-containing protein [Phanerochaete sordida]|uniref:GRAM domain-containing protein n=1 Tax=Phanerochaete sordida TaxID=48140 RepID=A0A9P3L9S0_9APHY|nr:GRAM domain-containing protein [Phanerochaete sordida]